MHIKTLKINSWVLFRPTYVSINGTQKFLLSIKNFKTHVSFEIDNASALLWLCMNGVRTRQQVISECEKLLNHKKPGFSTEANGLIEQLVSSGLLTEDGILKKDKRSSDMIQFSKLFLKNVKSRSHKPAKVDFSKLKKDERQDLKDVKLKFSSLNSLGLKIKIDRVRATPYEEQILQVFKATLINGTERIIIPGLGSGFSIHKAATSAIGEALERRFSFNNLKSDIKYKSYSSLRSLRKNALDPQSYRLFNPHQEGIYNKEILNLNRKTKLDWVWFEDALNLSKKILLPSIMNAVAVKNDFIGKISSSGCAAGPTPEIAKLKATLELVERDNLLFYWRTMSSPLQLSFKNANPKVQSLLKLLAPYKNQIKFFYLKSDLIPITIQATFRGKKSNNEPLFVSCCSSSLNPIEAFEGALTELLYVVSGFKYRISEPPTYFGKNFDNSIWDFADRSHFYGCFKSDRAYNFLFSKKSKIINFIDIPNKSRDTKTDLENILADFKKNKIRLYFRNNASKNLMRAGFWVYRAFSPDLILIDAVHRYRRLGSKRYFNLAKKMGLKRNLNSVAKLSDWPHPLP